MTINTPELRNALKAFAIEALRCANPNISELKFERFRLHCGVAFEISDLVINAQNDFVQKAIRKLGPIKGHAKVLDGALWDFVVSIEDETKLSDNEILKSALAAIESKSESVCEFFRPCPLVGLPDGVDRIEIGRVAIDRTDARIEEFRRLNPAFKFEIGGGWSQSILMTGDNVEVSTTLPPTLWSINLAAADPVREEEGLWLTDVALTILRMCVTRDDLGLLHPTVGKVEPHPFFNYDNYDHSFTLKESGSAQFGGITAANNYRLTVDAAHTFEDSATRHKIEAVFEAKPKTVAERFFQGCGWLTRGRRSKDRSDRLLYFFTAIESLLSDSDKTSPIIQTIARHAAVLLSDDNEVRHKIAKDMKELYSVRSALVHAGARGAFDIDSNSAQAVAEKLYLKVWDDVDLFISHSSFSTFLGAASFGTPLKLR